MKVISTTSRATLILNNDNVSYIITAFRSWNLSSVTKFMSQCVFRMLGLYLSAFVKNKMYTRIMVLLAYAHTGKVYFNGEKTNIETKALLLTG